MGFRIMGYYERQILVIENVIELYKDLLIEKELLYDHGLLTENMSYEFDQRLGAVENMLDGLLSEVSMRQWIAEIPIRYHVTRARYHRDRKRELGREYREIMKRWMARQKEKKGSSEDLVSYDTTSNTKKWLRHDSLGHHHVNRAKAWNRWRIKK